LRDREQILFEIKRLDEYMATLRRLDGGHVST
jgi:hypothetical protein